jgi:opacity protein-like surface antigen
MNGRSKFALILASLTIAIPQGVSAAPAPNAKLWNGTWHLNAAKSNFASSAKEQSETRTYKISGNKVTMKSSSKDLSGKALNFSYSAGYDGKWYPMIGNPNANRISLTVVSDHEVKSRSQLHGKPSVASTATVSADGKHLVIKRKMLRMKGAPTDVLEFDR